MIQETWHQTTGNRNITEWIQEKLGIWAPQYNLKAIEEELTQEIHDQLPDGYTFHNLAFHRNPKLAPTWPYEGKRNNKIPTGADGYIDLWEFIDNIDFWTIADNNEKRNGCQNAAL